MEEQNRTEGQTQGQTEEKTLEEIFDQLEDVISTMEGEVPLEESFRLYHRGMDMLKQCAERIDRVEKKMLILDEKGETHEF